MLRAIQIFTGFLILQAITAGGSLVNYDLESAVAEPPPASTLLPKLKDIILPLTTEGVRIVDQTASRVKWSCVNWPSHMEAMIPEGLGHKPIDAYVRDMSELGFNCVRYTMSVEMFEFWDQPVQNRFAYISKPTLSLIDTHNPWLMSQGVTVGDVFNTAMSRLSKYGLMVILDNHVSKAMWCCGFFDENRWWGKFDVDLWLDSLRKMARMANRWSNIVGVGLRNEVHSFRPGWKSTTEWFDYMAQGGEAVHDVNKDLLIIVGGMTSASYFRQLKQKALFEWGSPIRKQVVWEMHYYNLAYIRPFWNVFGYRATCHYMHKFLSYRAGFLIEKYNTQYTNPIWLSEFGLDVSEYSQQHSKAKDVMWFKCLSSYIVKHDLDWAYWVINGHYYYRSGQKDFEESWGLQSNHGEAMRNLEFMEQLRSLLKPDVVEIDQQEQQQSAKPSRWDHFKAKMSRIF